MEASARASSARRTGDDPVKDSVDLSVVAQLEALVRRLDCRAKAEVEAERKRDRECGDARKHWQLELAARGSHATFDHVDVEDAKVVVLLELDGPERDVQDRLHARAERDDAREVHAKVLGRRELVLELDRARRDVAHRDLLDVLTARSPRTRVEAHGVAAVESIVSLLLGTTQHGDCATTDVCLHLERVLACSRLSLSLVESAILGDHAPLRVDLASRESDSDLSRPLRREVCSPPWTLCVVELAW